MIQTSEYVLHQPRIQIYETFAIFVSQVYPSSRMLLNVDLWTRNGHPILRVVMTAVEPKPISKSFQNVKS